MIIRQRTWNSRNAVRARTRYYKHHIHLSLVDVAAKEADAHKRLAFVAAFAMSNYSSTIGRIAKPFNPMLVSRQVGMGASGRSDCPSLLERNV